RSFRGYKRMADGTFAQLDDRAFFHLPDPESNSIAILAKHDFVKFSIRICAVKVLILKVGKLKALYSAHMPEADHQPGAAHEQAVVAMHVITGFNVVHNASKIICIYDIRTKTERHAAGKENHSKDIELTPSGRHGRSLSCSRDSPMNPLRHLSGGRAWVWIGP